MSLSTIANPASTTQKSRTFTVYEYSLTVHNPEDNDTQELTAAFTSIPLLQDWQQWLNGWNSCDYFLNSQPILIRTI